jgi:hypothetical protein
MPKYRVLKHVERKKRRPVGGRPEVPICAIQLGEDVAKLERIAKDLETIDPWNIGDSRIQSQAQFCENMLRSTIVLVRTWHRYAKRKLQTEYLAP